MSRQSFLIVLLGVQALFAGHPKEDWPQFRGVNRDGVAQDQKILTEWPEEGLKLIWKRPLGSGFSSIAVYDGKLYTMFSDDGIEFVGSFDKAGGEEFWRTEVGKLFVDEFGDGPRATPTIDGKMLYAFGTHGDLVAVRRKNGKKIWHVSFPRDYGSAVQSWAYSASPLIEKNMILIEAGAPDGQAIVALDKKSGQKIWGGFEGIHGYTSPIAHTFNGQRQLIFMPSEKIDRMSLVAYSPRGKLLWRHDIPGFNIAMPVLFDHDKIFVSASGNDDGGRVIRLIADGDSIKTEELWATRFMRNHFNTSIYHDGHLYGFSVATLTCIDAKTGALKWRKRGLGKGSLVLVGDKFIVLGGKGKLALIEASSKGYHELASFQALTGKCWTMPTLVDGVIYLRNLTEMAAYIIRKDR